MKKIVIKIILILACLPSLCVYGQQINIGSQCPDVSLSMLNYKKTTVKISDFKGQLLIIDFWATWCGPCVNMIPKTDTLQKQFEGRAAIIPVTYESGKVVNAFYEGYNRIHHIMPYTAFGDTGLKKLFKPNEFPHYIWIDQDGKVIAITTNEEVTALNIQRALNGDNIKLKLKRLDYTFDRKQPFFTLVTPVIDSAGVSVLDGVPQDSVLFHSVLTKYRDRFPATQGLADTTRISAFNNSIKALYKACLGRFQFQYLFDNVVRVETRDSLLVQCKLVGTPYKEWLRGHTYCYELIVPKSLATKRYDIMASDLNNYFGTTMGIEGVLEKRVTKCLVLQRITTDDRIAAKDTGKYSNQSTRYHYSMHHGYIYLLMNDLMFDFQTIKTPLIDETGYTGKINIKLDCNMHNMTEVNQALEKYGLKFVEQNHPVNFVVIRDKLTKSAD